MLTRLLPAYQNILDSPYVSLHLFRAPASVRFPHIGRRLDAGDELEDDVADTDETDDGASNDAQDAVVQQNRPNKDVKSAAADEGEKEGGVAGDLGRDLELEETDGCIEIVARGISNHVLFP